MGGNAVEEGMLYTYLLLLASVATAQSSPAGETTPREPASLKSNAMDRFDGERECRRDNCRGCFCCRYDFCHRFGHCRRS